MEYVPVAGPTLFKNIRNDPEKIPMTEPMIPIIISKFLERILIFFMIIDMFQTVI